MWMPTLQHPCVARVVILPWPEAGDDGSSPPHARFFAWRSRGPLAWREARLMRPWRTGGKRGPGRETMQSNAFN